MRSDIDSLMEERNIDTLLISGKPSSSSDFLYLAGPLKLTGGYVLKKRGENPVIICGLMERDEAAKSGLPVKLLSDFDYQEIMKESRDTIDASAKLIIKILKASKSGEKVALYGVGSIPQTVCLIDRLRRESEFEFIFEAERSIISEARITKDEDEIAAIKRVGEKAEEIFSIVVEYLATSVERDGVLYRNGEPLTIGRMKSLIKAEAETRNLDVSKEEVIFAQGRDAAVPHSRGEPTQKLSTGATIVFDFCPQDSETGYFFDITRTFCVGYVPDEVELIYKRVLEVQTRILESLEVGSDAKHYDEVCSEMFEEWGYPTPRKNPGTTEGYVHGLGHGVGLLIHEPPRLSLFSKKEEPLRPGFVFTVEPGLYFPDRGYGVRLEDVVAIHRNGDIENLTPFPKEILIPIK